MEYRSFHEIKEEKQHARLYDELLPALPDFCEPFFQEMDRLDNKALSSLIGYATDIKIFLEWLKGSDAEYADAPLNELPVSILSKPTVSDVKEFFISYLPAYTSGDSDKKIRNKRTTAARKLATLKKFYHYFLNLEPGHKYHIDNDPVSSVKQAKDKPEPIKTIDFEQTGKILEGIEDPDKLFNRKTKEKAWSKRQAKRDAAIILLLSKTGMRVSELQGINLQDIDFDKKQISIYRKGRDADTVYLSGAVIDVLKDYIETSRQQDYAPKDGENALFLSRSHGRISVSQIERMVEKYTRELTGKNGYTPHKFRSGFATEVIKKGYSVKQLQNALNHADPSTSLKYYTAATTEDDKKELFENL